MFPPVEYPRCWDTVDNPFPIVHLNYDSNTLTMNCTKGQKPKYVLGPVDDRKLVLRHEVEDMWEMKEYSKPVKLEKRHEFALATCNEEMLDRAVYIPRFNETLYKETAQTMQKLRQAHSTHKKPLIVLMMIVDSFSRKHFFRKLHKTVDYLNHLNSGNSYKIYDFFMHNIIGTNSVGNQAPILGSNFYIENIEEKYIGDLNQDFAGEDGIWTIYKKKGFVTYFGLESCDNSFPRKLGRMPNIDHVSSPFYCATYKFTDYKASKSNRKQRCIGPHMSHYYIFNYTQAFTEMYSGLNQWLYVHVDAAHESSGQHAATLDLDLKLFLEKFLEYNANNDVVVFLEGDHGMRYGDWFKNVEAFQENRLPAFFFINPHNLLKEIEYSYDTLHHNSLRLNTKLDMRKTLIYLSGLPYGLDIASEELYPAVNMYKEKVNNNRTCAESGIPPWQCGCLVLETLDESLYNKSHPNYDPQDKVTWELQWLIYELAEGAILYLNSQAYTPHSLPFLCKKLTLNRIHSAYALNLDPNLEEFKLEISVLESSSARFEVTFLVSTASEYMTYMANSFPIEPLIYNGYRKKWRILNISRLDKYGGICELMSRELEIESEFCICKDVSELAEIAPGFYDYIFKTYLS